MLRPFSATPRRQSPPIPNDAKPTATRLPPLFLPSRGTSGDLRHTRRSRYRCSLPGLAGFAGPRCTEPEAPRSGSRNKTPALHSGVSRLQFQFNTHTLPRFQPRRALREKILLLRSGWWLHIRGIYPIDLERPHPVYLYDRLAFAHRKMPQLSRHRNEISDIHRLQFRLVELVSHSYQEHSPQHRHILVRRMPVRLNLGPVRATQAQHEWLALSVHIARDPRDIAASNDRRPLQVSGANNLVRGSFRFFLRIRTPAAHATHTKQNDYRERHVQQGPSHFVHCFFPP